MFYRFVTDIRDARSHQKLGVVRGSDRFFHVVGRNDWQRIESLCRWLNRYLRVPRRFARSRKRRAQKKAICWFRESAQKHLEAVRKISAILAQYGVPTEMIATHRPGYVVYEDRYQIAAVPFRDTIIATVASIKYPVGNKKNLKQLGPPQVSLIA